MSNCISLFFDLSDEKRQQQIDIMLLLLLLLLLHPCFSSVLVKALLLSVLKSLPKRSFLYIFFSLGTPGLNF